MSKPLTVYVWASLVSAQKLHWCRARACDVPTLHCGLACSRDTEEENERPAIFFGRRINFHMSDRGRVSPMDFVLTKTTLVVYGSVLQLSLCTTVTSIDVQYVWCVHCDTGATNAIAIKINTLFSLRSPGTHFSVRREWKSQSALQARDEMARVKYLREKPLDCFFRWKLLFTACPSSSVTAKN